MASTRALAADLAATAGPTAPAAVISVTLEVYAGIHTVAVRRLRVFTVDDASSLLTTGRKDAVSSGRTELMDLPASERALLEALPRGSMVLHDRDLPPGGRIDIGAYPDYALLWRPPFHIVEAPRKPWWRFW